MKFEGFIGPSSESRSPNVNAERTVNLYLEAATEGGAAPKSRSVLYGTPGLSAFGTAPTSPIRGLWANEASLYAVAGNTLYSVSPVGVFTARGTVGNDGKPVQFFANGTQLLIVSNGTAYCDSGSGPVVAAFTSGLSGTGAASNVGGTGHFAWEDGDKFPITMASSRITIDGTPYTVATVSIDGQHLTTTTTISGVDGLPWTATPNLPAQSGAFLDGYFIVSAPYSRQINLSAINDGNTWAAIDFALKEGYPDHIQSLLADHEELWIFGTDTIEVFQNTGNASFPLERISGAFIHHGSIAPNGPVRLSGGVAWLSSDPARGGVIAYLAQGFSPQRISTHAVEAVWDSYATAVDAVSFTYTENGHEFWIIQFPTANATWCFDATSGTWTQRGWWNGASNDMQRQMFHAFAFGKHLVGDWQNGAIYQQSTAFLNDNGTAIHWERRAPHQTQDQKWLFYSRFELDMEVGTSLVTPAVSLSWSDDNGHTFTTPITMTPDKATYAGRLYRNRLGKSRDRIWRVTGVSGATRVALVEAFIDAQQGT